MRHSYSGILSIAVVSLKSNASTSSLQKGRLETLLSRLTSVFLGILVCWLLNVVQLGIAFFLLSSSEKLLPAVYTLSAALGLVQIGYVVPLWRYLRRKGLPDVALGLLMAACATLVVNALIDYRVFGPALFR